MLFPDPGIVFAIIYKNLWGGRWTAKRCYLNWSCGWTSRRSIYRMGGARRLVCCVGVLPEAGDSPWPDSIPITMHLDSPFSTGMFGSMPANGACRKKETRHGYRWHRPCSSWWFWIIWRAWPACSRWAGRWSRLLSNQYSMSCWRLHWISQQILQKLQAPPFFS